MNKETMTIHKALCELKLLENRIEQAIAEEIICNANKHSNNKIGGLSIEDYKKLIVSRHDKAVDLIARRKAIKKAVTLSNAVTKIELNGETYTIAEAIEMKNHGIINEKRILSVMKANYAKAQQTIQEENGEKLDNRADEYVVALYGAKESKTNTDDIAKVREEFIKQNSYEFIDPLDVEKKINELETYINDFLSEVDSAISTSNALTVIEFEY